MGYVQGGIGLSAIVDGGDVLQSRRLVDKEAVGLRFALLVAANGYLQIIELRLLQHFLVQERHEAAPILVHRRLWRQGPSKRWVVEHVVRRHLNRFILLVRLVEARVANTALLQNHSLFPLRQPLLN